MWHDDDPDRQESLEYVLGATAHLLAQMGDQQAALLLEDVAQLSIESENRGLMQEDIWTNDGSLSPKFSTVYYVDVEPYLQPRFTQGVLDRILPVLRSLAQRTYLPDPEFLDTRLAMPDIDTSNWRETLRQQYATEDVTNSARKERLDPQSPVVDGLTFTNAEELAVYEALVRLQAVTAEDRTFAISPLPRHPHQGRQCVGARPPADRERSRDADRGRWTPPRQGAPTSRR
ncbi:hypothetical protein [Nocardioides sp. TF02-7]|uniref:hypothetical protein n=1 Tax=Nocardioides sp. TF02-7 TaxID=2917724 RepID=UPI001F06A3F4|nr:hypothetical protein [Nocardioides sp. TF02-7]UMG92831.1 hypothetical protein MF408_00070 [Nocardioides sp. TF02-7]